MTSKPLVKLLAGLGGIGAILTAFSFMQYLPWVDDVTISARHEFTEQAVPAVWTMAALHLFMTAFLSFGLSFYKSRACAVVLIAFGIWLMLDAAIIYGYVGSFIIVYMLAASGLFILTSGLLLRRSMTRE